MAAVGGGFSWKLAKYGRRKGLVVSAVLWLLGSFWLYVGSLYAMMIGRGIIGIGFGITSAVVPLLIREIATARYVEYCVVTIHTWFRLGFLCSLLLNFLLPENNPFLVSQENIKNANFIQGDYPLIFNKMNDLKIEDYCARYEDTHIMWREMVIPVTLVPIIQLMFLFIVFRNDHPTSIQNLRGSTYSTRSSTWTEDLSRSAINCDEELQQSTQKARTPLEIDTWKNLCKFSERKKVIASMMITGFQYISGLNLILNYGLSFIYDERLPRINLSFTIIWGTLLLIIPSAFILKKFGRKHLFMITTIISCFWCWILFQLTDQLTLVNSQVLIFGSVQNFSSAVLIWIYSISFSLFFSSTPTLYCAETLTDKGMAITKAFQWIIIAIMIILPFVVLEVVRSIRRQGSFRVANSVLFFVFSGVSMLGFFCAVLYVVETKGKSKKQLSEDFRETMFRLKSSLLR